MFLFGRGAKSGGAKPELRVETFSTKAGDVIKQGVLTKKPVSHGHGGVAQAMSSSHQRNVVLRQGYISWHKDGNSLGAPLGTLPLKNASVHKEGDTLIISAASKQGKKDGENHLGELMYLEEVVSWCDKACRVSASFTR